MSDTPQHLKYTTSHEWVDRQSNNEMIIGITHHAQKLLGDVVFVELPAVGDKVVVGKEFGVVESVKAASDLYSPLSGEVIAINEQLATDPSLVNHDTYQAGWMIKVKPTDPSEFDQLLDATAYLQKIETQSA